MLMGSVISTPEPKAMEIDYVMCWFYDRHLAVKDPPPLVFFSIVGGGGLYVCVLKLYLLHLAIDVELMSIRLNKHLFFIIHF